ncbi:MAG: hypothetical protein IIA88_03065, partial [Bacteroidetes bacterium]|nr:hypothetical protein [Bacteroidota bacterium]
MVLIFYKQVAPTVLNIIGFLFSKKSRRDELFVEAFNIIIIKKLRRSDLFYTNAKKVIIIETSPSYWDTLCLRTPEYSGAHRCGKKNYSTTIFLKNKKLSSIVPVRLYTPGDNLPAAS